MKIFLSMSVLQKEKLVVIKKELLHLWNIADFYRRECHEDDSCSQREKIALKLYDDINRYLSCIETINKEIDEYYCKFEKRNDEYLSFLTLYDHYNNKISDLLSIVKLIQSKLLQFQQEHFNQYMPAPNIGKRYSTKGFLDYLKIYHVAILKSEGLAEDEYHPITLWGHTDSFRAHKQEDSLRGENCKSNERYIEIPFWNYEIPFMLPVITHEIGHIVLEHEEMTNNSLFIELRDILKKNKYIKETLKKNKGFLTEIFADMFAFFHHGEVYIVVLAHEVLGLQFAEQFYNKNINDPVSIHPINIDEPKFMEGIMRLYTLLAMYDLVNVVEDNHKKSFLESTIEEIIDILDWLIIEIKEQDKNITNELERITVNSKNTLAKIYHLYYDLTREYEGFHSIVNDMAIATKSAIVGAGEKWNDIIVHFDKMYHKDNPDKELIKYRKIFTQLIDSRLRLINGSSDKERKIKLKNEFRKLILKSDKVLTNEDGDAYELAMFKTRMDSFKQEILKTPERDYFIGLLEEIQSSHNSILLDNSRSNIDPMYSFDYYSSVALIKKKEELTIEDINKFLKYDLNRNKSIKYYVNKHALILLREEKDINDDKKKYGNLSVFVSLSLHQNNSEYTLNAIEKINDNLKDIFETQEESLRYEIYKSLGPKEIIVHIKYASLNAIFKIKKGLFEGQEKIFHRSHTVICFDAKKADEIIIKDNFKIGSSIRAKFGVSSGEFRANGIEECLLTTGVQDYILHWKKDISMKEVISFCNSVAGDKKTAKCTDIQTFIGEILEDDK